MIQKIETFVKKFTEKRKDFQDPKISFDGNILVLANKEIGKMSLIGKLFLILAGPLIVLAVLTSTQLPLLTAIILIGFATIWFTVALYKRIKRTQACNELKIDLEKRLFTIAPQDYLRQKILIKKKKRISFDSIDGIETKQRNYDKFNKGYRLILKYKTKKIVLVDIWTEQLGLELNQILQKIVTKK